MTTLADRKRGVKPKRKTNHVSSDKDLRKDIKNKVGSARVEKLLGMQALDDVSSQDSQDVKVDHRELQKEKMVMRANQRRD